MTRTALIFTILISLPGLLAGTEITVTAPPLPPVLKYLSVNQQSSSASLGWTPSPSPEVTGYVIYRFRNNEGYAIDTLWNPSTLEYTDYGTGALFFSEAYVVAAIDNELNISPLSNAVSTIFLSGSLDTCNNRISLSWSPYKVSSIELLGYEIYASANGGEFIYIQTINPDSVTYDWTSFEIMRDYSLKVKAVMADNSVSESNHFQVRTNIPRPPSWIEIMSIDGRSDQGQNIKVIYDPNTEIASFTINRRDPGSGDFIQLASVNSTGGSFTFNDITASRDVRYTYRVDAVNRCGTAVISSSPASNIVLSFSIEDYLISLRWNPYTGWSDGPSDYIILWKSSGSFDTFQALPHPDTLYTIDYRNIMFDLSSGESCFLVEARRYQEASTGFESFSNIVCIETIESVFVPNAFTPDDNGLNDTFYPVLPFTPSDYLLIIRNKAGRMLFRSSDFRQQWDGTLSGSKLPPDVYLWYMRLKTPSGRNIERTGSVALIYNR